MRLPRRSVISLQLLLGFHLLLLVVHGLEIDFSHVNRREPSTLNHVSDVAAQIGVNDLRTRNACHGLQLAFGQVADLKNTGLLGFDQNMVWSLILLVTLAVTVISNTPSPICSEPKPIWMSTEGASCDKALTKYQSALEAGARPAM